MEVVPSAARCLKGKQIEYPREREEEANALFLMTSLAMLKYKIHLLAPRFTVINGETRHLADKGLTWTG